MKITIKNCNNIDLGTINIEKNKLNIKFGANGTGKSTLAKAIQYKVENEQKLDSLLPFKLQKGNPNGLKSEVLIEEGDLKSISIFNEEYVKQFLFKPDELISNSFEIFIKTERYLVNEKNIENQLESIKNVFVDNHELEQIILDFENLSKGFKTTKDGLSEASAIAKGVNSKFYDVPENLKEYTTFIQNKETCVSWLDWQMKGDEFMHSSENCPFCATQTDEAKKEKIKSVSVNYDKNIIKNFIEIIKLLENLGKYFSPKAETELERITKITDGLKPEEKGYLSTVKGQIDSFLQRLKNLRDISFNNLKEDKVNEKIGGLVINVNELFDKLDSEKTKTVVDKFNVSLNETLSKITVLQKDIGMQKSEIRKTVDENHKSINQFLKNAGYKYQVSIEEDNVSHKIKLKHIDFEKNILGGDQHLSFGERNAFALVLFMYEALHENPDLIILDDPISSFDKNKKYAILQMLFREPKSFKDKTVLMLTHDIEPVIDTVKGVAHKFKGQVNASFIKSKSNELQEIVVTNDDILSFHQIFEEVCKDNAIDDISKLVYMRRNFEIINNKGDEYQILSDLFHTRTKPAAMIYRKN